MTSYWAIAIGINQYQCFQPLVYAQRDARAMRDFWVGEAGFSPDQCLLLIDSNTAADRGTIYPNRDNVHDYVTQLCHEQLQPGSFLWCFFSGYGMRFQGQDYLMPIDGDPEHISKTGIAVEELFKVLRAAPTDNILLTLDMKRSPKPLAVEGVSEQAMSEQAVSEQTIGEQTIALADAYSIATLLSHQPEQTSHETLALRQGLFTAAMLEGLRYRGCITPESLAHYLNHRLPALSDYHWRPKQQPLAMIPTEQKHQLILPQRAIAKVDKLVSTAMPIGTDGSSANTSQSLIVYPRRPTSESSSASDTAEPTLNPETLNGRETRNGGGAATPQLVPVNVDYDPVNSEQSEQDDLFWQRVRLWGGAAVLLLLAGVLLSNWTALKNSFLPDPETSSSAVSPDAAGSESGVLVSPTVSPDAISPEASPQTVSPAPAVTQGTSSFVAPPEQPGAESPDSANQASDVGNPGERPASSSASENVRIALQNQRQQEALSLLDQVPSEQRNEDYNRLRTEVEQAVSQAQQRNREILNNARASLSRFRAPNATNQASDFNQAIAQARQIQPGQPLYDQAQQSIATWSQVILDLAEGRAGQGNFDSAIAAARLIRPDRPEIYSEAQQAIAQWQQQQTNQATLQRARSLIRRSQASSYNQAIAIARQIPAGQARYDEAQQLISEWSQAILDLARSRAEQGRLNDAVRTAVLIPSNTPAHAAAQEAIANWRNQL